MKDAIKREPVYDPQELERLLVARQNAGDVDGMTALFEPDAVIDCGGGRKVRGLEAMRSFYVETVASGHKSSDPQTARSQPGLKVSALRADPARSDAAPPRRPARSGSART
jgi:hypothetical protein